MSSRSFHIGLGISTGLLLGFLALAYGLQGTDHVHGTLIETATAYAGHHLTETALHTTPSLTPTFWCDNCQTHPVLPSITPNGTSTLQPTSANTFATGVCCITVLPGYTDTPVDTATP